MDGALRLSPRFLVNERGLRAEGGLDLCERRAHAEPDRGSGDRCSIGGGRVWYAAVSMSPTLAASIALATASTTGYIGLQVMTLAVHHPPAPPPLSLAMSGMAITDWIW